MAEKKHFPKMVYLSGDPEDHTIIQTQEEWPDGAKAHWLDFDKEDAKADAKEAKADAKAAKAAKAAAEKEYRQGIFDYLDEHNVDYAKNMSTDRLEATKVALDQHLESLKDDPK